MDHFTAWEVFGQGTAAVLVASRQRLDLPRWDCRPAAFGAAAEAVPQGLIKFATQILVLVAEPGYLVQQLADHRLQDADVLG